LWIGFVVDTELERLFVPFLPLNPHFLCGVELFTLALSPGELFI
jgi:hypothetical protein